MEKAFEEFFNQHFNNQGNVPNPFDNEAFAQFISDQIKNAVPNQSNENGIESNELQNIPNPSQRQRKNSTHTQYGVTQQSHGNASRPRHEHNVFEAHDFVIARIAMANMNPEQRYVILLNSYELFLKEEGQRPSLRIHLPKPVNPKRSKITTRNGIIEIQMMKQPPEPFSEFEINGESEEW